MHASPPSPNVPRTRRLLRVAVVLLLLLVATVATLPFAARRLIGSERLRAMARDTLTNALGRPVAVAGEVGFTLTPWPTVSLQSLSVADAPEFGDTPILEAGRVEMTIRLWPLWSRVVAPGSVRVRDLRLHLKRDAEGRTNWEALPRPKPGSASEAPDWQLLPEPRDVLLESAAADYHDAVTGRSLAVSGVRLATGLGQPFAFSLGFKAEDTTTQVGLDCRVQGEATFDAASGHVAVHSTQLAATLTRDKPLVPGGATPVTANLKAGLDYEAGVLTLSHIDLGLLGTRLAGTARLTDLPSDPRLGASLELSAPVDGAWRALLDLPPLSGTNLVAANPPESLRPLPAGGDGSVLAPAPATDPGHIHASFDLTADAAGLDVSTLRLLLPQGEVTASGVWRWGASPQLDAALTVEGLDLAALPVPAGQSAWPWPIPWLPKLDAEVRLDIRRCSLASLAIPDAHATLAARKGSLRLYPVSAVLPDGIVSLDARLYPGAHPETGLDIEAKADLSPGPKLRGAGVLGPTSLELKGSLGADGVQGKFSLQSRNPQAAASLLGQASDLPASALDTRGAFSVTPGVGRLAAKAELGNLEIRYAGTVLRGRLGWDAKDPGRLGFDLGLDSLDLDKLPPLPTGSGTGEGGLRAEGKLHGDRIVFRGVEARNVGLALASGDGRLEANLTGAEIFGGKLTGKLAGDSAASHLTGALQLTGAAIDRLPGLDAASGLSGGQLTAKANFETALDAKGHPTNLSLTVEAEAPQINLKGGSAPRALTGPRAKLTLKSHSAPDNPDGLDLESSLTLTVANAAGLRETRLAATGPISLDNAFRPRHPANLAIEASGFVRTAATGPVKELRLTATGPLVLDWAGGFNLGELTCNAGGLPARLKLWRKAGETGPASFSLETPSLAPRPVLAAWGLAPPAAVPAEMLSKASLTASGTVHADGADVRQLRLILDDTTITGQGSLPQFDPLRGKWTLSLDRVDLDAYSPPATGNGTPPPVEKPKPFDLELLRDLALDIHLTAGWLKKGKVVFEAASIMTNAHGGLFTFRLQTQRFYGGRFFSEIRGDARDATLRTVVELKLESFECARFLKDWADGDTLSSGAATFVLAAKTYGLTEKEMRGHISGNASLQVTRGDLKVKTRSGGGDKPPTEDRIPFETFSSSWNSTGGVAKTDDFRIDSPRMQVSGTGFVDLRDESINLSVLARLTGGSEVPATIIGPLDNPKLIIDSGRIFGDIIYNLLQGIISIPGKAVSRILQIR